MWTTATSDVKQPTDCLLRRVRVDLSSGQISQEVVACQGLDGFLGGIARSFKLLANYTVNQLRSDDCKPRFAGRGGMGSIMGSKNLIAIVAQAPDVHRGRSTPALLEANKEISRGPGSRNYRDPDKGDGNGGTWRNVAGLHPKQGSPWMEPFDFAQDRLREIQEAGGGVPGFHPGYNYAHDETSAIHPTRR